MHLSASQISTLVREKAQALGFASVGITQAVQPPGAARLDEWLAAGYAGTMHYLADRRGAYDHPSSILDGARSIVMMTLDYFTSEAKPTEPGQGRVSRYAWGTEDYHDVIHNRLKQMIRALGETCPEGRWRGVVDTAPLMERDFAQMAGLGWIGKHTLLLNRQQGSWFFLAALVTDVELEYNTAPATDHCGTCTACLDVCPTDAFPAPYVLDASRCISYLTIEHRDSIPAALRPGLGEWIFGCDLCQDVCPWNRRAPVVEVEIFEPREVTNPVDLAELFDLTDDDFRERFRKTPLWRTRRRGLLRNAAVALGNRPAPQGLAALAKGLADAEPLVRAAAAWALRFYPRKSASELLTTQLDRESDEQVLSEIAASLEALDKTTETQGHEEA